ncbi:MAG: 3-isopropylmalate dehydratase small subunit [Alphaproteobacteria bacterium]
MQAFQSLTGIMAPLLIDNIDTDMIIPKQFLKTITRTGLGKNLFDEMRYDENGNKKTDFILNQEPYNQASILLSSHNFGCGSSREHAPWALLDFGIRCVIAVSFADIFYNNTFKNGILPIQLPLEVIKELEAVAKRKEKITVDLQNQLIKTAEKDIPFKIDSFKKECLLKGLDDIDYTLQREELIKNFEQKQKKECPWL